MDRRLQRQLNALNGDQFNIQPSRRKTVQGLFLYFVGEADTGETGAYTDLGSIVVTRDGDPIANLAISTLANVVDINWGSNLFDSTEASDFFATVYLPFFEPSFQNALGIVGESELNFEYLPGSTASTVFTALNLSVYAEYVDLPELYTYKMMRDNQTESSAVASKPYPLNRRNVTAIYLADPDTVLTDVELSQNGEQILSRQPFNVLLAATLKDNRLETTDFDLVKLLTHTPGIGKSTINRESVISFTTSGSGDVPMLVCSMDWN